MPVGDTLLRVLKAIERVVVKMESGMLCLLMFGMAAFVFVGIAARLMSISVAWTNEAAQILLVWLMFVGANLGTYYREHVGVTIFPDRLHGAARAVVLYLIQVGFLAFCVYIVWTGFMLVNMQVKMGGTTFALPIDVPRYLISLMLPISFLAGTLHLVCQLLEMDPAKVPRGSTVEAMPQDPTSMIGLS